MGNQFNTPKHNNLIYDVGMHKAEDTEYYLKKGFRVVSIEADPELAQLCREKLNDYTNRGQLTIIEGAVVDPVKKESGQEKVSFYKNKEVSVWGTVHENWAERNKKLGTESEVIEVDTINFTRLIKKYGIPYYMKIDIEGSDMICVEALKSFTERPSYISLESDKTNFGQIKSEIDTLINLGYYAFKAVEQSTIPVSQTPPNPAKEGEYAKHKFKEGSSGLFGDEISGKWKSRKEILMRYRIIAMGYFLIGDNGVLKKWKYRGGSFLRRQTRKIMQLLTKDSYFGWYDTHARHSSYKQK